MCFGPLPSGVGTVKASGGVHIVVVHIETSGGNFFFLFVHLFYPIHMGTKVSVVRKRKKRKKKREFFCKDESVSLKKKKQVIAIGGGERRLLKRVNVKLKYKRPLVNSVPLVLDRVYPRGGHPNQCSPTNPFRGLHLEKRGRRGSC